MMGMMEQHERDCMERACRELHEAARTMRAGLMTLQAYGPGTAMEKEPIYGRCNEYLLEALYDIENDANTARANLTAGEQA